MKKVYLLLCIFLSGLLCAMDQRVKVQTFEFSTTGKLKKQEDRCITKIIQHNGDELHCTGIFDGHGGDAVSQLAYDKYFGFFEEHLQSSHNIQDCLKYACAQCEGLTKENLTEESPFNWCGSTVLTSCYDVNTKNLCLMWLGDSQAAVGNENSHIFTTPHRPIQEAEKLRIEAYDRENGNITTIKNDKLNGWIAVSRSLGDHHIKDHAPVFIAEPETTDWEGDVGCAIYACDGFWDKASSKEAFQYVLDALKLLHEDFYWKYENCYGGTKNHSDDDDQLRSASDEDHEVNVAQRLVYIAVSHKGSSDNTTVVVQIFNRDAWLEDNDEKSSETETDTANTSYSSEEFGSESDSSVDPKVVEDALANLQNNNNNATSSSVSDDDSKANPLPNLISGAEIIARHEKKIHTKQNVNMLNGKNAVLTETARVCTPLLPKSSGANRGYKDALEEALKEIEGLKSKLGFAESEKKLAAKQNTKNLEKIKKLAEKSTALNTQLQKMKSLSYFLCGCLITFFAYHWWQTALLQNS